MKQSDKKYPGEKLLEYNRKFIMDSRSDHDLLIRVDERTERIDKWCSNHDVHHFRYNIMAWGIALGAIITLAICIIKLI